MFTERHRILAVQLIEEQIQQLALSKVFNEETLEKCKQGRTLLEQTFRKKLEDLQIEAQREMAAVQKAEEHAKRAIFEAEAKTEWLKELGDAILNINEGG